MLHPSLHRRQHSIITIYYRRDAACCVSVLDPSRRMHRAEPFCPLGRNPIAHSTVFRDKRPPFRVQPLEELAPFCRALLAIPRAESREPKAFLLTPDT